MAEEEKVTGPQRNTEEEEEEKDLPESPEEREPADGVKLEQDQKEVQLSSSGCPSGTEQQQLTLTCSPQVTPNPQVSLKV